MNSARRACAMIIALLAPATLSACQTPDIAAETAQGHVAAAGVSQFARLLGHWHIEQQVRQEDGSWQRVDDAAWTFRPVLGGHAIQDEWVQPPFTTSLEANEARQFGTNLRVYDPEHDRWHIVWASSDQRGFTHYIAEVNANGHIVMTGEDADRPGVLQRITYFDFSGDGWRWKMEFRRGDGSWVEVARIQASPDQR